MSVEDLFLNSLRKDRFVRVPFIQISSIYTTSSSQKVSDDMRKFEFRTLLATPMRFSWSISSKACLTACEHTKVLES